MTVTDLPASARGAALEADAPLGSGDASGAAPRGDTSFAAAVAHAFDAAGSALERADSADRAFIAGRGDLQAMTLERAQADVTLALTSAVTSHVAQSLTTILGMQI